MDSIVLGLPELECKRLRDKGAQEGARLADTLLGFMMMGLGSAASGAVGGSRGRWPSVHELKGLRRLVIDGPAKSFRGEGVDDSPDFTRRGRGPRDKLTHSIFVYSTLAPILPPAGPPSELIFFQVGRGLAAFPK